MSIRTTVVSEQEWNAARESLLVKEKQLTRARDALAGEGRRLSMVRIENGYRWGLLDITPFGRQEEWHDALEGVPQKRTGSWVRRHDEYTPHELAGGRS